MKNKFQAFVLGLIIGVIIAAPLGINFGRGAPLISNPFTSSEVREQAAERLKEGAGRAVETTKKGAEKAYEEAKEKLHEATKPVEKKTQ